MGPRRIQRHHQLRCDRQEVVKTARGSQRASPAKSKPSAAQAAKASQAASKVLGSSKALPPATVTEGQTGSGPGFNKKSHKFDGSFFGQ